MEELINDLKLAGEALWPATTMFFVHLSLTILGILYVKKRYKKDDMTWKELLFGQKYRDKIQLFMLVFLFSLVLMAALYNNFMK